MLTTSYPRWRGDPSSPFIEELCKELVKKEIDVTIVAPHDKDTKDYEIIEGVKIHRFKYWITKKGQRLSYNGGMPYNFFHNPLAKIQLPFFLIFFFLKGIQTSKNCDIIHAQFLLSGFIGVLIKKFTRKNLLLTIHAGGLFSLEKMPLKRKIAKLISQETSKIQVVSNYIKKRFLKLLEEDYSQEIMNDLTVLPMGVNTNRFDKNKNITNLKDVLINEINLLFVGRISDKKGLPTLLDAVNILKTKVKNFKLFIVGDGPLKNEMEEKSKNLGLNDYIEFTGRVSNKELTNKFLTSQIVIVPSIVSNYGDTEGLPVVILEAMAAGKPVIASNVSGIPEIVIDGKSGILVQPNDEITLANKIQYLSSNQKLRKEMGDFGREIIIKNYSWDIIVLKTMELYKNII
jgi:glycosyltransferase involved in cell wall biosynthesis